MNQIIYNPALKETIVFVKTSLETGGAFSELKISLEPGGGNPLHLHRSYTELFTAVNGELGLELKNKKKLILKPGESYLVKKGEVHRFFNPGSSSITFTNQVTPGSTGLENTLRILCGLAADGLYNNKQHIPRNIFHMAVCGAMSDMRLTGLKGAVTTPLIKLFAALARKTGIEQKLIAKYCI
ncbi:cupin domain-containing protein [Parapedobacter koreensis]|uniref:Mannose-6-phosphate isomerase, cupin superfamily n=1 Tax=Parapedobacter koreensis TaxID=332977 RepID=A0A1H7EW52_9SPHI|nr:cupin domain-containing protein [Parapedobacter koreensis]SEK17844.1 Mannose-6-phosphate isomerase, cupin superfamily [Parapedobacter koreensis]